MTPKKHRPAWSAGAVEGRLVTLPNGQSVTLRGHMDRYAAMLLRDSVIRSFTDEMVALVRSTKSIPSAPSIASKA